MPRQGGASFIDCRENGLLNTVITIHIGLYDGIGHRLTPFLFPMAIAVVRFSREMLFAIYSGQKRLAFKFVDALLLLSLGDGGGAIFFPSSQNCCKKGMEDWYES
ncbi:hypothetical protein N4G58_05325 [Edwardsiella piscicida]|nr:hypothetical protein N4G58_05325 [Edwardsiella piscicida]